MAPGTRNKFGAPMFEPEVFRKQICSWRKYLWHCQDFSEPPAVIRRPRNCSPFDPPVACALWCSQIVYIRPYSLNTTTAFYFVTECSDVTVLTWARVLATTHFYFTWPWPGLDTYHAIFVTYPGCNVVPSVTR